MKWLFLTTLIVLAGNPAAPGTAVERRLDKSGEFSYELPKDWRVLPGRFRHDLVMLPAQEDGFNRNIVITDQAGEKPLEVLKQMYEKDLARLLKEFALVSSEIVELPGKGQAVRLVHTNTMPGLPVRQLNYIIELDGKRYYIACTTPKGDGAKHDKQVEAFVISIEKGSLPEGELQSLLDQLRKEAGVPGAILGIASGDGSIKVVASGLADREAGRPMAPGMPYFLGSITKTYTAVVVLRLAEEGRLSLDDPVARFLPVPGRIEDHHSPPPHAHQRPERLLSVLLLPA